MLWQTLTLLVFLSPSLAAVPEPSNCYNEGHCQGALNIDVLATDTLDLCYEECQGHTLCQFFTWYKYDRICELYTDCDNYINGTCTDGVCYTGMKTCTPFECFQQGYCIGHIIKHDTSIRSAEQCLAMCQEDPTCKYFSIDESIPYCAIYQDCLGLDPSCNHEDCIYGQYECPLGIQPASSFNKLMVIGGSGTSGSSVANSDVEIIDLSGQDRTCTKPPTYPSSIDYGSMGIYFDDQVLVCGGYPDTSSCYNFNLDTNSWRSASVSMSYNRYWAGQSLLGEDEWWISGGEGNGGSTTEILRSGGGFTSYVSMPSSLSQHGQVRVNETHVVFFGDGTAVRNAYLFNKNTQSFSNLPSLNVARGDVVGGLVRGSGGKLKVVAAGGIDTSNAEMSSCEILDMDNPTGWTAGPLLPQPLQDAVSVPFGDTFLIVGGHDNDVGSNNIYEYDNNMDSWITRPEKLTIGRYYPCALLVPDEVARC